MRQVRPSEHAIQQAIQQALTTCGVPCFRLNTGAMAATYHGRTRFVRFGFPGCPDLMALLHDGRTLWIEVKTPDGRLRPAQRAFRDLCLRLGVPWVCARSLEDLAPWVPPLRPGGSQRTRGQLGRGRATPRAIARNLGHPGAQARGMQILPRPGS